MKSWKTTTGGMLALLGAALQVVPEAAPGAVYVKPWSDFIVALGAGLIGMAARDNNITSEQVMRNRSHDDTPTKT
jgi:hypothetical protein